MKKRNLLLVLTLALVFSISCCTFSTAAASSEKPVLANVIQDMSNESQAFASSQFNLYAADYGFDLVEFDGRGDVTVQAAAITTCIAQGVDVIIINPANVAAIVPSLMEAKAAGIIIGLFSSDLAPENQQYRDFFCGLDDTAAGEVAAQAFIDHFPDGADIVEIGGQAGHDAQLKRHNGFMKGIEGSKINVLDSQNCDAWATDDVMGIMEDFIVKYGDMIQGVFCHWDNGATGVIQAMEAAGMSDIFLVAVDGCRAGYDQVMAGTQDVCIGQNFTTMAKDSLALAQKAVNGEPFEEINYIQLDVITPENVNVLPYPEW